MDEVNDWFEPLPVTDESVTHLRPNGAVSGGYYCMMCGSPLAVDDPLTSHGLDLCSENIELVNALITKNSQPQGLDNDPVVE